MKKRRIFQIIIAATLVFGLVACGEKKEETSAGSITIVEESRSVGEDEKTKNLQGEWAEKEFTYDSFKETGNLLTDKIKSLSEEFGLEVKEEEKIAQVDGITANVKSIYIDNAETEENKLESMKFLTEFLGQSQEGGKYQLKMSLKFNGEKAIQEGNFNFGDTSLAKYAGVITGQENRDYSEINKKIMDVIKSDKPEGVIEDEVNGLYEEIAVSKEYIVYTLQTKEFKFQQESNLGL